jgi:4-amino-4-deoxy-L-arabinose transferase-like glycosyltransferase
VADVIAHSVARPRSLTSAASEGVRDLAIAGGLTAAAILLRLPYLWDIPRLTDELQEILWALSIARGEILPLTAVDSYYGPLWSYLLAAAFRVIGISDWAPRLLAALLAAVTVGLTYLIGREITSRWAALVGAALLVTSGGHVIITSHTARSNSTTPLLLLLVCWALLRAIRLNDGRYLVAVGFLFALALQSHISAIAFAPGLALALLIGRPRLLISPWIFGAAAGAVVGYGNMVIYNVQNSFYSLVHAQHLQEGYTDGRRTDLGVYLVNMQALLQSLSRLLSGTIDIADSLSRFLYSAAAGLGLGILAWRRMWLPLLFCASAILVLPYFNPRYGPILSGRYIVPLLPFAFIGIGVAVEWLTARLPARATIGAALALIAVCFPLVHLLWYYQEVLADDRTNAPLYSLANSARGLYQPGDLFFLDEVLEQEPLTGGGNDLKALRMLVETRGLRYEVTKINQESLGLLQSSGKDAVVIMDVRKRSDVERRAQILSTGAIEESASGSGRRYGAFRVGARTASPERSS